jgi:hypothetical protein
MHQIKNFFLSAFNKVLIIDTYATGNTTYVTNQNIDRNSMSQKRTFYAEFFVANSQILTSSGFLRSAGWLSTDLTLENEPDRFSRNVCA